MQNNKKKTRNRDISHPNLRGKEIKLRNRKIIDIFPTRQSVRKPPLLASRQSSTFLQMSQGWHRYSNSKYCKQNKSIETKNISDNLGFPLIIKRLAQNSKENIVGLLFVNIQQ